MMRSTGKRWYPAAGEVRLRTAETAASAIPWTGCRATVSGGQQYSDSVVSSKNTTAMSSGQPEQLRESSP